MKKRKMQKKATKEKEKLFVDRPRTFSVTVSDTSETFLEATSVNFQPTSATLLVNFEAPRENADQLCKEVRDKMGNR